VSCKEDIRDTILNGVLSDSVSNTSDNKVLGIVGNIGKNVIEDWLSNLEKTKHSIGETLGDLISNMDQVRRYVVVFDDLERASIEGKELLGYINYFVEHMKSKVIILSNEDQFTLGQYRETKEKIVGQTFEVHPEIGNFLDYFICKNFLQEEDTLGCFYERNKNLIRQIFLKSEYYNLRALKQVLANFGRLFDAIPLTLDDVSDYDESKKEEIGKKLLEIYMVFDLELKSNGIDALFLEELLSEGLSYFFYKVHRLERNGNDEEGGRRCCLKRQVEKIEKYRVINLGLDNAILGIHWIEILLEGVVSSEEIESAIRHSSLVEGDDSLLKLRYFRELSDDTFDSCVNNIKGRFFGLEIYDIRDLLCLTCILFYFEKEKLIRDSKKSLLGCSKKHLACLEINDKIRFNYDFRSRSIYLDPDESEKQRNLKLDRDFSALIEPIVMDKTSVSFEEIEKDNYVADFKRELIHRYAKLNEEKIQARLNNLVNDLDVNISESIKGIFHASSEDLNGIEIFPLQIFHKRYIDPEEFAARMIGASNEDILNFSQNLFIYKDRFDCFWLDDFRDEVRRSVGIDSYSDTRKIGKLSNYLLKNLVLSVDETISQSA